MNCVINWINYACCVSATRANEESKVESLLLKSFSWKSGTSAEWSFDTISFYLVANLYSKPEVVNLSSKHLIWRNFHSFNNTSQFPWNSIFCPILYSAVRSAEWKKGEHYGGEKLIKISLKYANVKFMILRGTRATIFRRTCAWNRFMLLNREQILEDGCKFMISQPPFRRQWWSCKLHSIKSWKETFNEIIFAC